LKKSEERLRSLFELAPDGIATVDLKGFVTSVNNAWFHLTGFSKDEVIGQHFSKIGVLRARDTLTYLKLFSSIIRGKVPKIFEFSWRHKDGTERCGEAHLKLIKVGNRKRELLVIARDITERKRVLEELERSNRELDDYTYAVSHDLKAPLRTIEAFSGFLLEDYAEKLDEEGKDYLKRIADASMRMKELIDDLLLISRVGRKYTEIELVDLNKIIEEIRLDFESQLEERGANILSVKLPIVKTQISWIRQLFANLIGNGLKFNKSTDPKVWVNYEEKLNEYVFSVKDNGIGIDKKYHEKIFNIFQRLHSQDEYPGTGAGLTICKKIVESFGGKIWVESKPGKGSTFYFTHPKDISNKEDESEAHTEVDQSLIQVEEDIPVNIK